MHALPADVAQTSVRARAVVTDSIYARRFKTLVDVDVTVLAFPSWRAIATVVTREVLAGRAVLAERDLSGALVDIHIADLALPTW
tara:strand:- start:13 stop:267 length:255 start_codon:yes stop_codon:yes gene_type:complete